MSKIKHFVLLVLQRGKNSSTLSHSFSVTILTDFDCREVHTIENMPVQIY